MKIHLGENQSADLRQEEIWPIILKNHLCDYEFTDIELLCFLFGE